MRKALNLEIPPHSEHHEHLHLWRHKNIQVTSASLVYISIAVWFLAEQTLYADINTKQEQLQSGCFQCFGFLPPSRQLYGDVSLFVDMPPSTATIYYHIMKLHRRHQRILECRYLDVIVVFVLSIVFVLSVSCVQRIQRCHSPISEHRYFVVIMVIVVQTPSWDYNMFLLNNIIKGLQALTAPWCHPGD